MSSGKEEPETNEDDEIVQAEELLKSRLSKQYGSESTIDMLRHLIQQVRLDPDLDLRPDLPLPLPTLFKRVAVLEGDKWHEMTAYQFVKESTEAWRLNTLLPIIEEALGRAIHDRDHNKIIETVLREQAKLARLWQRHQTLDADINALKLYKMMVHEEIAQAEKELKLLKRRIAAARGKLPKEVVTGGRILQL